MRDFTRLQVWQLARRLIGDTYRATARMPAAERFGLQSQIRRAAVSIAANVAEGCGRETPAELRRYVSLAAGSASELESHLIVCGDLAYLPAGECEDLRRRVRVVRRMLWKYSESTRVW